jgi:PAS domain S-box-containing protein
MSAMPSFSGPRTQLTWPWVLALLAVVYVTAAGSVAFAPEKGAVAAWWPAAGLSIVLVALSPRRRWPVLVPAILVATTVANLAGGRELDIATAFGVGDAAEALVAGALLRRGDQAPRLASFEDLVRIGVAAVVGAIGIALFAPLATGVVGDGSVWTTVRTVYTSHATSTLVILPAALAAASPGGRRRSWETAVQLTCLAAVTAFVFTPGQTLALTILPLPFLVWGALRLDLRTVTWEVTGFAVAVTYLGALGGGPLGSDFESGDLSAGAMATLVQVYVLCTAVVATPLAVAMDLRRRLVLSLERSELLFRRNFTESLVGMLLMRSSDGHLLEIVELNDAAAAVLGPNPPTGRTLAEVLDTAEDVELIATRMLAGSLDGWKSETGLRDRPGARVNVAVSVLSTTPEPMFSAQLQDITAEYAARRGLEAAEKLTSATLDTTAAIILVTDLTGRVVRVNAAASALTGYSEAELVGRPVWETLAPADAADLEALVARPHRSPAAVSRESIVATRSGDALRVLWNSDVVRDEDDHPAYAVITGIDVTAERLAAGLNEHLLAAAITTALIGIDTRGLINVFNVGAENLLGYAAAGVIGRPFVDLLEDDLAFDDLVAGLGTGDESPPRDRTWLGADGSRHTVSMTLSVASDAFAARVGYLCVGRDVTEARASREMLVAALEKERLAVERLRQLDAAKSEFVSTVSHELRTPVTSIVGYTEVLEDGSVVPPAPEQVPLLASIARNGQRLILLCDDLLTLGGLDSGATHSERTPIDLAALLPSVEDTVRPFTAGRRLDLCYAADPDPVTVLGDRVELERVLVNLLGNAVKFTEDGGRVECRVERHDDEAWICVSDTGIGIPAEEQAGLFQRFFRSSTAQERAIQGTGLGLSIVAAIVAAHGGRIDVRSAHLEGTTFTVRLPLVPRGVE